MVPGTSWWRTDIHQKREQPLCENLVRSYLGTWGCKGTNGTMMPFRDQAGPLLAHRVSLCECEKGTPSSRMSQPWEQGLLTHHLHKCTWWPWGSPRVEWLIGQTLGLPLYPFYAFTIRVHLLLSVLHVNFINNILFLGKKWLPCLNKYWRPLWEVSLLCISKWSPRDISHSTS